MMEVQTMIWHTFQVKLPYLVFSLIGIMSKSSVIRVLSRISYLNTYERLMSIMNIELSGLALALVPCTKR